MSQVVAPSNKPSGRRGAILVAEDHAPLRTSVVTALRRAGFVAEGAATGEQAVALLRAQTFDVLLADINMPGNAQLELLSAVSSLGVAVVLMTGEPSVGTAIGALQAGAVDYLTKPIPPEVLLQRLDAAAAKTRANRMPADGLQGLDPEDLARLSQREREIVSLLSGGYPAKEVASRLGLSANTVRNHIKSVFAKLRIHSQLELLVKLRGRQR